MALTLLLTALSGGAAALLCGLAPTLSWWWMAPIWLGAYVGLGLLYILVIITLVRFLPPQSVRWVVRPTVAWVMMLLGYRIRLTGADALPDTPFLLVCNHRSAFDPLCTVATLARHMAFIAKPGVFRIPVIGTLMRRLGYMPIDRENARNAVATIKEAAHLIADTELSVGIYPEGTRSKSGDLLPFHAGSFKIAALAKCPVAVAAIRYEKRPLWGKRVHLCIADVMDADYVTNNNTAAMAERAVTAITAALQ